MKKEKVVFDSNILIFTVRRERFRAMIDERYPTEKFQRIISFASKAEPLSMALRKNWGNKKHTALEELFASFSLIIREVSDEMIEAYAELEAYSLNQHPTLKKPEGESAYKIGKNDLWIAATAQVEKARLLTADRGFVQFNAHFFPVDFIEV